MDSNELLEHIAFRRVILDDPEDTTPRLVYSDWLDENGHADRAQWIRLSCALEQIPIQDDRRWQMYREVEKAFSKCRPSYWEDITSVTQLNDRGIYTFRFPPHSATTKRVGKILWLKQAFDEGWLQRIAVKNLYHKAVELLGKWKPPVSEIPLFVEAAPQIKENELQCVFNLPQLEGLSLPSYALRNLVIKELNGLQIRELKVELRSNTPDVTDSVVEQISRMEGLEFLHLQGHDRLEYGDRPNDGDLDILSRLFQLKRLRLTDCPAVTDNGLRELQQKLPSLTIHLFPKQ